VWAKSWVGSTGGGGIESCSQHVCGNVRVGSRFVKVDMWRLGLVLARMPVAGEDILYGESSSAHMLAWSGNFRSNCLNFFVLARILALSTKDSCGCTNMVLH
jgi:hypothetical protein